jgi:WD40 repeat protein
LERSIRPDGKTILGDSQDGKLRLWDITTGEQISEPLNSQVEFEVLFSVQDRLSMLSGSRDGTLRLWTTHDEDLIAYACTRLPGLHGRGAPVVWDS